MLKKPLIVLFYPVSWPGKDFRGRIPFGLLYLERMVRDYEVEIMILDECIEPNYYQKIEANLDRIILACVSTMTGYQIKGGIEFSKQLKKVKPTIPIAWGGWHPTLMPEQTLKEYYVDLVAVGQGENVFRAMVYRMLQRETLEGIPGLWRKSKSGEIIAPPPSGKFQDIKQFPRVNFKLLDLNKYVFESTYSKRCIGYHASHGCPFDCSFCCVAKVYEKRWYNKEVTEIIDDLKLFKEEANIDSVIFDDDNFFVGRAKSMALINALKDSGLNLLWDTSSHPASFVKTFNDEDVKLIYESGCRRIYCGAESGSEEMLILVNKKSDVEANYDFLRVLNKHGIRPLFSTIIAFPSTPDADMRDTFNMIRQAKLIDRDLQARIFFYTPYPGTPLFELSLKKGLVPPRELEGWTNYTLRKFIGPWWTRDYRWEVERFANFYFPLANPRYYQIVPGKFKTIAYVVNKFFYPIVNYRFQKNDFRFPFEAELFLRTLKLFNKITRKNFCLGYESYIEQAPPLNLFRSFIHWVKQRNNTAPKIACSK